MLWDGRESNPLNDLQGNKPEGVSRDTEIEEFAEVIRQHAPTMRLYARYLLGETTQLDALVRQAFITAWEENIGAGSDHNVRARLIQIVSCKAAERFRHGQRTDPFHETLLIEDVPYHEKVATRQRPQLERLLDTLPIDQRRCWVLRELGNHTETEVSTLLGISRAEVHHQHDQGRTMLCLKLMDESKTTPDP